MVFIALLEVACCVVTAREDPVAGRQLSLFLLCVDFVIFVLFGTTTS
jgi:hypothetical protein